MTEMHFLLRRVCALVWCVVWVLMCREMVESVGHGVAASLSHWSGWRPVGSIKRFLHLL